MQQIFMCIEVKTPGDYFSWSIRIRREKGKENNQYPNSDKLDDYLQIMGIHLKFHKQRLDN